MNDKAHLIILRNVAQLKNIMNCSILYEDKWIRMTCEYINVWKKNAVMCVILPHYLYWQTERTTRHPDRIAGKFCQGSNQERLQYKPRMLLLFQLARLPRTVECNLVLVNLLYSVKKGFAYVIMSLLNFQVISHCTGRIQLTPWRQNQKVHHRTHNSPPTVPILCQVNPFHPPPPPPTSLPKDR
jgi:hypothetical protein